MREDPDEILAVLEQHKARRLVISTNGFLTGRLLGLRTLLERARRGVKGIGFGITVSDHNAKEPLELYPPARATDVAFATAVVHHSYDFHTSDNRLTKPDEAVVCSQALVKELLETGRVKN